MAGLRIVFAGSPHAAVPSLTALADTRHDIAAVVTREDSPHGRRRVMTPTAVAVAAESLGLPVVKANRLTADTTHAIGSVQPDLGVIVAYGGLIREPLLSIPSKGWINLHFSLLPRWRGAAPVQRAIIAGDEITGASVFQLVEELDAGDVYGQLTQSIKPHETSRELLESLAVAGADLLTRVVDAIAHGTAQPQPQLGDITLAPKLTLVDGRVDFSADASTVDNLIRGVTDEPGAFAFVDGIRLKILQAAVRSDAPPVPPGRLFSFQGSLLVGTATVPVELITVQPAGRKAMSGADWWRGRGASASESVDDVSGE